MVLISECLFSDAEKLDENLAKKVGELLSAAIAERGSAVLVVSGGNTPKNMFRILSQEKIDWQQVTVLLADERWVETWSERSNEKMVRACLLQYAAAEAHFVGYYHPDKTAEEALPVLNNILVMLDQPIDVLLLGMGEDGHTASLFPCAPNAASLLNPNEPLKLVIVEPSSAPDKRVSLSFPVLCQARSTVLHITGEMKKEVLQKITSGTIEAPIGEVLASGDGLKMLYWSP
ncbi:6-phosphogluconolactonase [Sneathiella sp.]|jgi:6-phosphogluconolactonase|uniref:6-phosphogluconolactonase n=1 Tax=Sneathiella sp. TaxID=1964365 RepID=UPI0039E31A8F